MTTTVEVLSTTSLRKLLRRSGVACENSDTFPEISETIRVNLKHMMQKVVKTMKHSKYMVLTVDDIFSLK